MSFIERFVDSKAEREARKFITELCQRMSLEDFRYAAENDLEIVRPMLVGMFLKPGEEKAARRKAKPFRFLVQRLATTDNITRVFSEISPPHGMVLREHRHWLDRQITSAKADVFGS